MSGLGVEARDISLAHGDGRLSVVSVRTLSRRPAGRNPLGGVVEVAPLDFSDPTGFAGRCGEQASFTTPTGCGTHEARRRSTARSRTPRRCSRLLRARTSEGSPLLRGKGLLLTASTSLLAGPDL